jgi:KDO2-lipid IV(A) lauroyltransferase
VAAREAAQRRDGLRHRVEYLLVVALRALAGVAPWSVVRWCGRLLGRLFYLFDGRHRRITLDNLAHAFPEKSDGERLAIARGVFAHFGVLAFDILKFTTLDPAKMLARVEIEGEEHVRRALEQRDGYLLCTGHFGFWETHGLVHALRFGPIGVLARPLDNPLLNDLLERVRQRTGNVVIYKSGAIRHVLRQTRAGRGVAVLIDQHTHTPDAVTVEFFGRPAATTSSLATLSLHTGAPVIPVFSVPLPGARYRLIYEQAVEPPRDESAGEILAFTDRCTRVLESYVRRYPQLWLWMHRRWREEPTRGIRIQESGVRN